MKYLTRGAALKCLALALFPGMALLQHVEGKSIHVPIKQVPIEKEWKQELFSRSTLDLMRDYQPGDTLVLGGRLDSGRSGSLTFFGQKGTLALPVEMKNVIGGRLLRGRFKVVEEQGRKRLKLQTMLGTLDTLALRQQAAGDYHSLFPELAKRASLQGSPLPRSAAAVSAFRVVPPPEGWQVLYVTLQQSEEEHVAHIAFRYELSGGQYHLVRCWAEQKSVEPHTEGGAHGE